MFQENSGFEPTDFQDTIICESPDKAIYKIRAKIEYESGKIHNIFN